MHIKYLPQCPVQSRHATNVTYFIMKGRCIGKKKRKGTEIGFKTDVKTNITQKEKFFSI